MTFAKSSAKQRAGGHKNFTVIGVNLSLASLGFASQRLLLSSSALTAVLGVCSANISTTWREDACFGNSIVYRNHKVCDGFASLYDGSPSYIEL